jgi:hypothetical protein
MRFRIPVFALCLATIVAIGCSGGVASAQNSSEQTEKSPIGFPPNYKARIAALLAAIYLEYGEGQPEISNVQNRTGLIGETVSVCIQYSFKKKHTFSDGKFRTLIFGERILSLGKPRYKRRNLGPFDKCSGTMTPFRELERAAQVLKGCLARGETRCVLNQEPGRRDVTVVRTRSIQPAAPRLTSPE